jgi:NAD/NADP transhydrogenase alpha subunit
MTTELLTDLTIFALAVLVGFEVISKVPATLHTPLMCYCPANPVVQVIMPATAARPHPTELLLCGHHYRVSRQALAAANATVTELSGPGGSPRDALLTDLPGPRVQVS